MLIPSAGSAGGTGPVIGNLVCQDITVAGMQAVVNAAPTVKRCAGLQRCISAWSPGIGDTWHPG